MLRAHYVFVFLLIQSTVSPSCRDGPRIALRVITICTQSQRFQLVLIFAQILSVHYVPFGIFHLPKAAHRLIIIIIFLFFVMFPLFESVV